MNNIKYQYNIILSAIKRKLGKDFLLYGNGIRPGPAAKFSDVEVIALAITAEELSIHSENSLFKQLEFAKSKSKRFFPNLICRRQFSDRRKQLIEKFDELRELISDEFPKKEKIYVVDSTPIRLCKYARRFRNKIGKKSGEIEPCEGYNDAQEESYYGYKLHAIINTDGVLKDVLLTPASNKTDVGNDRLFLRHIRIAKKYSNCTIVGDKGYISKYLKYTLLKDYNLDLQYSHKKNQIEKYELPRDLFFKRRLIETTFSQLTTQFNLQRNLAKSFRGFMARLYSKLCSHTMIQYINLINNLPVNNIQNALLNIKIK